MSYVIKPKRNSDWRKHTRNNLLAEVIMHEKIVVNKFASSMLTKIVAKVINWAKRGDLHSRRLSLRYLDNRKNTFSDNNEGNSVKLMDKLFDDLGKRYKDRLGGYTRISKVDNRRGDNSPTVIFSLV